MTPYQTKTVTLPDKDSDTASAPGTANVTHWPQTPLTHLGKRREEEEESGSDPVRLHQAHLALPRTGAVGGEVEICVRKIESLELVLNVDGSELERGGSTGEEDGEAVEEMRRPSNRYCRARPRSRRSPRGHVRTTGAAHLEIPAH